MHIEKRIDLLVRLGEYILADETAWKDVKDLAEEKNSWFTRTFIDFASVSVATHFLEPAILRAFVEEYQIPSENPVPVTVGLVMAGNLPLVGFHDWMCIFLSGNRALIKASVKDLVLITHLLDRISAWEPAAASLAEFSTLLKGCDAYIATGSNNSARYFDYYFSKYPHIIRHNRSSVAVLNGFETSGELDKLADDVHLFFGLGCRNVTKLMVPVNYDFVPLLTAFRKYAYFADHNKYKNNYDYQLALHLINNIFYMTNGSVLLSENKSLFSPISQLNYEFYASDEALEEALSRDADIQCIVGTSYLPFGKAQTPAITDFADGLDTMQFLLTLSKQ